MPVLAGTLTKYRRDFFKVAAPGEDSEMQFEQALSNLAHSSLRDKAPGLLAYELGFQLIEKSDDNDKAVGIFGFKVGPQLIYGPVFFLNGELKGQELCYLKASDTFVPMSEDWINYLLARKPPIIGENMSRQDTSRGTKRPDLRTYSRSPASKWASADSWVDDAIFTMANLLEFNKIADDWQPKLPDLIKTSSACAVQLLKVWDAQPALLQVYHDMYGATFIKQAIARAAEYDTVSNGDPVDMPLEIKTGSIFKEAKFDHTRGGKLRVYTYDGTYYPELNTADLEKLAADNLLVKDDRDDATQVFDGTELKPMSLMTPNQSGLYSVLLKPDKFERCFIAMAPRRAHGDPGTVLVRLEGDKAWTTVPSEQIWAESQETENEYRKWFNDQPDAKSISSGETYVLIGPGGEALGPITVSETVSSGEGESAFKIYFTSRGYVSSGQMYQPRRRGLDTYSNQPETDTVSVGLVGGNRLIERGGIYYVPKSWKSVKLPEDADEEIRTGNAVDVTLGIISKTAELKLWADGVEAEIDGRRMAPQAAKLQLICNYGIREKTAEEMLNLATRNHGARFRLKLADDYRGSPYDQYGGGYSMPSFPDPPEITGSYMGAGVPETTTSQQETQIPSSYPPETRNIAAPPTPDPDMMNQLSQAAQTGQREILDTSTMAAMLRTTRSESLIDQYLGDVLKGLDRIGRLLFNFYWRSEIFSERYGDNEMHELEDLLQSTFENTGDLVLKLRQETIEPFPGESLTMGDGGQED